MDASYETFRKPKLIKYTLTHFIVGQSDHKVLKNVGNDVIKYINLLKNVHVSDIFFNEFENDAIIKYIGLFSNSLKNMSLTCKFFSSFL